MLSNSFSEDILRKWIAKNFKKVFFLFHKYNREQEIWTLICVKQLIQFCCYIIIQNKWGIGKTYFYYNYFFQFDREQLQATLFLHSLTHWLTQSLTNVNLRMSRHWGPIECYASIGPSGLAYLFTVVSYKH